MEALHTPFCVFVSSFTTSLIFIWLGRRRVERIMREVRELEKRNRRLERLTSRVIQKIRDKNRELRCEREYFDKFSAENEKYIFLGRFLFLAREKFFSRKKIALALGCSEPKINSLCIKYNIGTLGYMVPSRRKWLENLYKRAYSERTTPSERTTSWV